MITKLNDLEEKSADILNASVQAPVTEKVWAMFGSEFGSNTTKTVVVRAT